MHRRRTFHHASTVAAVLGLTLAVAVPRVAAQEHDHGRIHDAGHGQQPIARDPHAHHRAAGAAAHTEARPLSGLRLPDVEILDHEGRTRHFAELLPEGRVVINFIFTTCTTICPPMGAGFGQLQRLLDEQGSDARLISITVDPTVDTPQRLSAWSDRFGRGERWTLVTGGKREIDRLLKALRVFTPDKIDHAPIVLLGDTRSGQWLRMSGLAAPEQLIAGLATLDAQAVNARLEEER